MNLTTMEVMNALWDRQLNVAAAHAYIDPQDGNDTFLVCCDVNSHTISPEHGLKLFRKLTAKN